MKFIARSNFIGQVCLIIKKESPFQTLDGEDQSEHDSFVLILVLIAKGS